MPTVTSATSSAPKASAPSSDLHKGNKGPQVKQLQTDLVKLGYLKQADMNTGPGLYGPHTAAAMQAFQKAHHLKVTGAYDDPDRAAMSKALAAKAAPAEPPSPSMLKQGSTGAAVKLLQGDLVKLGYMKQADMNTGPGVFGPHTFASLRAFQRAHGLAATGIYTSDDRTAMAKALQAHQTPAKPATPPAASTGGKITTRADANKYFVTQWGKTAYNSANGAPYGYSDCCPTSCVMVASSLGKIAHPSPAGAEKAIDHMRDLSRGYNTNKSGPTNYAQLEKAMKAVGAKTQWISPTPAAIDAALKKGGRVLISGDPWKAWGKAMAAKGQYLNHKDPGNHSCAIMGKTASGKYLLADPLSKTGTIEVTAAQLESYWHAGSNGAMAAYR